MYVSHLRSTRFKICTFVRRKINTQSIDCVESHLDTLIKCIKEFIISYSQLLPRMESSEKEDLLKLMDMCDRIRHTVHSFNQQSCLTDVNILEKFFSRFVDSVLTQQIMVSFFFF